MTEHIREEQLALYVGGDLPSQESTAIATHLADCGMCQSTFVQWQEIQSFLRSSVTDPEPDDLAEVRTRITANLQQHQSHKKRLVWCGTGIAAALALFVLLHKRESPIPPTPQKAVLKAIPLPPTNEVKLVRAATRPVKHSHRQGVGIRAITLIAKAGQEPILKLTTADPNVVILWQSNNQSEH